MSSNDVGDIEDPGYDDDSGLPVATPVATPVQATSVATPVAKPKNKRIPGDNRPLTADYMGQGRIEMGGASEIEHGPPKPSIRKGANKESSANELVGNAVRQKKPGVEDETASSCTHTKHVAHGGNNIIHISFLFEASY